MSTEQEFRTRLNLMNEIDRLNEDLAWYYQEIMTLERNLCDARRKLISHEMESLWRNSYNHIQINPPWDRQQTSSHNS